MEILRNGSDKLLRSYKVSISSEDIAPQLDNILQRNAHKFKISGFRAGKAPISILRTHYGHRYIYEALQAVVEDFLSKQLNEAHEKISLKADYNIEDVNSENGSYVVNIAYHVFPTIAIDDYTSLKANNYVVDISDEYVAEEIERLRKNAIKWVPASVDTVEDGMRVTISGSSTVINDPHKNKKKKDAKPKSFQNQTFVVSAQSNTALMRALLGAKLGEQVTFTQDMPKGQAYEYCATIEKIEAPSEHELNDDFAIAAGKESLTALTEDVRNTIAQRFQVMGQELAKRDLLETFAAKYQCDVPENIFTAERENVRKQVLHETSHNSLQLAEGKEEAFEAAIDDLTRQRVRISLVISYIAEKEQISVTPKDVQQQIWMYAQMHGTMAAQVYNDYVQNPDVIRVAREDAIKNQTISFVMEKLEKVERKISREELIALDEENFPFIDECFVVAKNADNNQKTQESSQEPEKAKGQVEDAFVGEETDVKQTSDKTNSSSQIKKSSNAKKTPAEKAANMKTSTSSAKKPSGTKKKPVKESEK